ncbi:MAG: hypothetical protein Q9201_004155 [Fulgogasparrea decipioides]
MSVSESPSLADGACYDETTEQVSFLPLVFQSDKLGEIKLFGDPEEFTGAVTMSELIELLLSRIQALPEKPMIDIVWGCYSVATLYWGEYYHNRNIKGLDEALSWAEKANALAKEHKVKSVCWRKLTPELYLLKFEVSQMQEDLEHACHLLRDALAGIPENSLRGTYAEEFYHTLWQSYEYRPNARILEEAIYVAQIAEDCPCETEGEHGHRLVLSGMAMLTLGDRTQNRDHTRRAIDKFDQALSKGLDSHDAGRAKYHRSQAHWYLACVAENEPADLAQSFTSYFRSMMDGNLESKYQFAQFFFQKWEDLERLDTRGAIIDKADVNTKRALIDIAQVTMRYIISCDKMRTSPSTHAMTLLLAGRISEAYHIEFENHRQTELKDPSTYWMECWEMRTAPLDDRLLANQFLSRRLFMQGKHEDAWMNFERAANMIPIVCPQHFPLDDKKHLIEPLHEISIDACATALALGKTEKALEVLEQGRGLLHSHFDKSMYNINKLENEHKDLFERFERARNRTLYNTQPDAGLRTASSSEVEESVETVLVQIRRLPHYENFLRSLNNEEMRSLAKVGPIVVLVGSPLGQYAIIVREHELQSINLHEVVHPEYRIPHRELRRLSREVMSDIMQGQGGFDDRNKAITYLLKKLWKGVVKPISDALELPEVKGRPDINKLLLTSFQSHITWIRTGNFHRLPVNMAIDDSSYYPVIFAGRVTSSFAPSFRVLSTGRSREPIILRKLEQGFVVSMPSTSKSTLTTNDDGSRASSRLTSPWIRNAREETSMVMNASPNIKWNVLERPSPQDVQQRCLNSPFLHFICHGISDSKDPMRSHLRLWEKSGTGKGRVEDLTVSQIFGWTIQRVCVAFLSSCFSADISKPTFFEESMDICSTLNLAGVHDVVGSMWPVSDIVAAQVAEVFWSLFDRFRPDGGEDHVSRLVARALNYAVLITATKHPDEPLAWAGFVHVGGPEDSWTIPVSKQC